MTRSDRIHEPVVERLLRSRGAPSPERAIEQYVAELLLQAGQSVLPVNVELITSVLGIRRRLSQASFAGRIYADESGQLVMDLNEDDSSARRRFTCAHEIVHTAFPGFKSETRYRIDLAVGRYRSVRSEEEYLCDLGASMMLMPESVIRGRFSLKGGLSHVERLALEADVSLEAAGNRLASLGDIPGAFIVFEVGHKPADRVAVRHGDAPEAKLRVRYATMTPHLRAYVPPFKSANEGSVFARALGTKGICRGRGDLPGQDATAEVFLIEAASYFRIDGDSEIKRVLATAVQVSTERTRGLRMQSQDNVTAGI